MAICIGGFSLYYSQTMVKKLSIEERKKIKLWANAQHLITNAETEQELNTYLQIIESNSTIPVILSDKNHIIGYRNIDTNKTKKKDFLENYYQKLKQKNEPIIINVSENEEQYVYYDDSSTLKQLKTYPYYQLGIVALFIAVSYFAFSYSRKSEQNQVWVGLAKETAHQLGTPMSSLMGWVDLIESDINFANPSSFQEMRKDLDRLKVITERFSKIGAIPIIAETNIGEQLKVAINYIKTRSSEDVIYHYENIEDQLYVNINVPLFDWVIENICKNAIDSMEGKGSITIDCFLKNEHIYIDISDTGKGIPKGLQKRIFKPGFTTKKRGWGLGLSLVKRIIENYHKGHIFVKESIPNKKTTFRIILKQVNNA
ncbi:MAG: HAMP domain-containing sensor histidine kinase [Bacteroidota bacterium]|nr:HAMP domain-containing sensor histidine kinase [Bacteroidota bacterium]